MTVLFNTLAVIGTAGVVWNGINCFRTRREYAFLAAELDKLNIELRRPYDPGPYTDPFSDLEQARKALP